MTDEERLRSVIQLARTAVRLLIFVIAFAISMVTITAARGCDAPPACPVCPPQLERP